MITVNPILNLWIIRIKKKKDYPNAFNDFTTALEYELYKNNIRNSINEVETLM